jgi:Heterokaryon incompatibility protein (HET)
MDASQLIRPGKTNVSLVLNTEPLLQYIPSVMIDRLRKAGVPLDLQVGDWVYHSLGSEAKPFQIVEDLGDRQYVVRGLHPDRISASSLVRAKEQMAQPKFDPSLSHLSGTSLKGVWREFDFVLNSSDKAGTSQAFSEGPMFMYLKRATDILDQDQAATAVQHVLRLELLASMVVLQSSLKAVLFIVFRKQGTISLTRAMDQVFSRELVKSNWCRVRMSWLYYIDETMHYVASLLPSYEVASHLACSRLVCSHRPTSVYQQQAKHRHGTCACGEVLFQEADLLRILRSGGIPGISQNGNPSIPDEQRSYNLLDVTGKNYIAISHVWSQGLGNPSSNSLPRCQLLHLFQLIRKISSSEPYLWIDTISVPVTKEHKKIALRTLGQVYRQAHQVLVIDRHLLQVGTDPYERQIQLRASEWIGRL